MPKIHKAERPEWCLYALSCDFKKQAVGRLCCGELWEPAEHDGDLNTHRFCIEETGDVVSWQINKSDVSWFLYVLAPVHNLKAQLTESKRELSERTKERDEIRKTAVHQGEEYEKINTRIAELEKRINDASNYGYMITRINMLVEPKTRGGRAFQNGWLDGMNKAGEKIQEMLKDNTDVD